MAPPRKVKQGKDGTHAQRRKSATTGAAGYPLQLFEVNDAAVFGVPPVKVLPQPDFMARLAFTLAFFLAFLPFFFTIMRLQFCAQHALDLHGVEGELWGGV